MLSFKVFSATMMACRSTRTHGHARACDMLPTRRCVSTTMEIRGFSHQDAITALTGL